MLLALVHGALSHQRHGQLVGIVGALILAEPFGLSLGRGHAGELGLMWRRLAAGASLIALIALGVRMSLPVDPQYSGKAFAAILDRLPPSFQAAPVLNEYRFGGQLIFNGIRPFIDSRADLYGDTFLSRYGRIVALDRAELERTLSEYKITWAIFPADNPVVRLLDLEPGWRRLIEDDSIVIQARH
jgi:hypothetical protein